MVTLVHRKRRATGPALGSAVLLGVASGMRSTAGLGILVLRGGSRGRGAELPGPLAAPAAKAAAVVAIGAELVLDKLPVTGSRLEAPGLIGRVTFAAIGGALVARGSDLGALPAALVAAGAALASAKVFHDLRALADRRLPDPAVAVAEDALAIGVATLAAG
jgi:uncharacterized membrane protein